MRFPGLLHYVLKLRLVNSYNLAEAKNNLKGSYYTKSILLWNYVVTSSKTPLYKPGYYTKLTRPTSLELYFMTKNLAKVKFLITIKTRW